MVLRVVPGAPTTVDHVVITGLESTRDVVVRRELAVKEGEPLALDRVLESQRRLGALGLFDRVTITEMDPDSPQRRSVVVRAEEAPLTSVSYGVGYAEQDYLRGSVEVTRRNLFGMDRRLSAFARASFRGFRMLGTFREPYLLGRKQELFFTAFREEEDREAFSYMRTGVTLQTARNLTPQLEPHPARDLRGDAHLQHHRELPDLRPRVLPGHPLRAVGLRGPRHPRRPPRPAPRTLPPHGHAGVAPRPRRQHPREGVRAGRDLPAPHRGHARRPLRRAWASRARSARSSSSCPRPTASSRAATIRCAASAWTRCARTAATRSILGGVELRSAPDRLVLGRGLRGDAATSIRSSPTCHLSDLRYTAGLGLRYKSAARSVARRLGLQARPPPGREALPSPRHDRPCVLTLAAVLLLPRRPRPGGGGGADPGRGGRPPRAPLRGARSSRRCAATRSARPSTASSTSSSCTARRLALPQAALTAEEEQRAFESLRARVPARQRGRGGAAPPPGAPPGRHPQVRGLPLPSPGARERRRGARGLRGGGTQATAASFEEAAPAIRERLVERDAVAPHRGLGQGAAAGAEIRYNLEPPERGRARRRPRASRSTRIRSEVDEGDGALAACRRASPRRCAR